MAVTILTDTYSDIEMACPATYENGHKEPLVTTFGVAERPLSHIWTGELTGSTFEILFDDTDRRFRQQLISPTDRYWTEPLTISMTTRGARGVEWVPYPVFVGHIIGIRPTQPLGMALTLSDHISNVLLSDDHKIPYRVIGDGFINQLTTVSPDLDLETPEPIIYGRHRRVVDVDPASAEGFEFTPIYLGIENVSAVPHHVWLVAGHAVADITDLTVIAADGGRVSVFPDEGTDWLIPHSAGWLAEFGAPYRDRRSSTYGVDRRYTLIYGKVGEANPDAAATASGYVAAPPVTPLALTCFVDGIEPVGDGSGAVILDRLTAYKHFDINFMANWGPSSYQAGPWLTSPTWDVFGTLVPIIEESSYDDCAAIAALRLPAVGSDPAGYIVAAIIGARAGDRGSIKTRKAEWNRSCGTRSGFTHLGQSRVVMFHPTAAIKAAAPLYTDAIDWQAKSFNTDVNLVDQANRVPFRADFHHLTQLWKTVDGADALASQVYYNKIIPGDTREYPFAPGITAAYHLARLESIVMAHPPRSIVGEASIGPFHQTGPTDPGESLAYLDIGDYIRYRHFAAVGTPAQIRLAQIIRPWVNVGGRLAGAEALDCEDLIDYDTAVEAAPDGSASDACSAAIVITEAEAQQVGGYTIEVDTTLNGTDAITGFCGSDVAYHAAWWKYDPTTAQKGHVTTGTSEYDTVLSVWEGTCGALTLVDCNDNDGIFQTSFLELPFLDPAKTYFFLATGYGSADAGRLVFTLFTEPL